MPARGGALWFRVGWCVMTTYAADVLFFYVQSHFFPKPLDVCREVDIGWVNGVRTNRLGVRRAMGIIADMGNSLISPAKEVSAMIKRARLNSQFSLTSV